MMSVLLVLRGLAILFGVAAALLLALATAIELHRMHHPPRRTLATMLARGLPGDPGELGLTFTERTFDLPGGWRTTGWIIQGRQPQGPMLLISHGWGESRFDLLRRIAGLPELASSLVIYDLRGHGDCTAPRSTLGRVEPDDLLAILDQLPPPPVSAPNRPVVLLGYSMGSGISIVAAARDKTGRIAGVIGEGVNRWLTEPTIAGRHFREIPRYPLAWLIAGHLRFWVITPARYDRAAHAARLHCPLLLLHRSGDPLCPLTSARQIAAAAPHGTLIELPGERHQPLAATDPQRYSALIGEFLAQCANPIKHEPQMNTDQHRSTQMNTDKKQDVWRRRFSD